MTSTRLVQSFIGLFVVSSLNRTVKCSKEETKLLVQANYKEEKMKMKENAYFKSILIFSVDFQENRIIGEIF